MCQKETADTASQARDAAVAIQASDRQADTPTGKQPVVGGIEIASEKPGRTDTDGGELVAA